MWKLTLAPEFLDLDAMGIREMVDHAIHVVQTPPVPVLARAVVAMSEVAVPRLDVHIVTAAHVVDDVYRPRPGARTEAAIVALVEAHDNRLLPAVADIVAQEATTL